MELKEPRRKRRWGGRESAQQLLPIPLKCRRGIDIPVASWYTFTGRYNGDSVVISGREEMDCISRQGCFGKGSRSKSNPEFYSVTKGVPPFIRERQWKHRCSWSLLSKQSSYNQSELHCSKQYSVQNVVNCEGPARGVEENKGCEVVVLNDSDTDCDEEMYLSNLHPRTEVEPFDIGESLHLTLEEAFFLSFALGCLNVIDLNGVNLSLVELWRLFKESQEDFLQMYVAYHYFRSKGWVVKPGLKFGGDFVLYKQGPSHYHASYIVKVSMEDNAVIEESPKYKNCLTGWTRLMGLNRLAETAAKEILLCHVIRPKDISDKDLCSPSILSKFTVYEVLVQRWVSSQERGKDAEEA